MTITILDVIDNFSRMVYEIVGATSNKKQITLIYDSVTQFYAKFHDLIQSESYSASLTNQFLLMFTLTLIFIHSSCVFLFFVTYLWFETVNH